MTGTPRSLPRHVRPGVSTSAHETTSNSDRRGEKAEDHPVCLRRAAELREQQGNEKQLVKSAQPGDALAPAHVGPQHADRAERPEQHRQTAGRRQDFTPQRSGIERRNERKRARARSGCWSRRSTTAATPRPPRPARRRSGRAGERERPPAWLSFQDCARTWSILAVNLGRPRRWRAAPTGRAARACDRCAARHRAVHRWRPIALGRPRGATDE